MTAVQSLVKLFEDNLRIKPYREWSRRRWFWSFAPQTIIAAATFIFVERHWLWQTIPVTRIEVMLGWVLYYVLLIFLVYERRSKNGGWRIFAVIFAISAVVQILRFV